MTQILRGLVLTVAIALLLPTKSFAAPKASAPKPTSLQNFCELKLLGDDFFKARKFTFDKEGRLKFTPENIAFLHSQRLALQKLMNEMGKRFFEMDHAIRRLVLARMMQTHVFLYGDPGGAKSDIARQLLAVPKPLADGTAKLSYFALQLHQLLGDAPIKGFIDHLKLKNLMPSVEEIDNRGAMLHFDTAMLDEVDKGNPVVLAALLDVLNEKIAQYGPITLKVKTKTVIATSNMTVDEFLQVFKDQGMESTARALLDRMPFKVYSHNYVTDQGARRLLLRQGADSSAKKADEALSNPEAEYSDTLIEADRTTSDMPFVDWVFLGRMATKGTELSQVANDAMEDVIERVRVQFNTIRTTSQEKVASEGPDAERPEWYPPTIFSMRNIKKYSKDTIANSLFLDLMLLPVETLSTETLVKMIEKRMPIDHFSIWRLQDMVLTAAPGDPILAINPPATGAAATRPRITLQYGPQVEKLLEHTFDRRQRAMLSYFVDERNAFNSAYTEVMKNHQDTIAETADILSSLDFLKNSASNYNGGIEEFLVRVNPKAQPTP